MATDHKNSVQNDQKNKDSGGMKLSTLIGDSKRLTLTYIVLAIWLGLAIFAIIEDADFYGLAVYFASGLPLILGYLWSETSRPSPPSMKDVSDLVKNIGSGKRGGNRNNDNGYGGYNGGDYNGGYNYGSDYGHGQQYSPNQNNQSQDNQISIFSDDASTELKITQDQLATLKNIGYVDLIGDKNIFKKSLIDQINSLISDNGQQPTI